MENDTIWKVGLVVLVLLVVVGVYNNNNRFSEEVTGEAIGDDDSTDMGILDPPPWGYHYDSNTVYLPPTYNLGIGVKGGDIGSDKFDRNFISKFVVAGDAKIGASLEVGNGITAGTALKSNTVHTDYLYITSSISNKNGNIVKIDDNILLSSPDSQITFTGGKTRVQPMKWIIGSSANSKSDSFIIWDDFVNKVRLAVDENTGDVSVTTLGGSGNVYVCADNSGRIYKSKTPCVK